MADLAFGLLLMNTIGAILVALHEFMRRGGYVTLPFLTSFMFIIWYLPQAWTLRSSSLLPDESLARLFFMSLLCFWALVIGWYGGVNGWRRPNALELPVRRLIAPAFAMTLFAMTMKFLIEMQPPEIRAAPQWTGVITILYFFGSISVVSMTLSTAMVLKQRNYKTLLLFALNLSIYLPLIIIYFRRSEFFEFTLAVLLGLLFVRGQLVPRLVILASLVFGFFIVNGISQLRAITGAYELSASRTIETRLPTLDEIAQIDWLSIVDQSNGIRQSEVMNAAIGLEATARYGTFTLGAQYWNRLVLAYLPGQIIGTDLKRDLLFGDDALEIARVKLHFNKRLGTTSTGFLAPYQDFWYFGCLVWWLTGYIMGRLMYHALRGGTIAYLLYASLITNAVLVTTHFGYYLLSESALILLAAFIVQTWLARSQMPTLQSAPTRPVA